MATTTNGVTRYSAKDMKAEAMSLLKHLPHFASEGNHKPKLLDWGLDIFQVALSVPRLYATGECKACGRTMTFHTAI